MSETLFLARIESASGTSQSGKAWTRWDFIDNQGTKIGSTFTAALASAAQAHLNGMVDVERTHDGKGYKVTALRPSNGAAPQQPPQQFQHPGSPPPPVQQPAPQQQFENPGDRTVSIRRQVALKAAAHVCSGRDVGTADVLALAQSFDNWLASNPEDVPF